MLELREVTVRFDNTAALAGIDLSVANGEVVCMLGPSGSGKTTMLRAVAGLEPLADGAILHNGRDLAGVPPHRRDVGLMFQDHALFPHRDVLANVAFGPRVRGAADAAARAREMLELVGLAGFDSRRIDQLSGGEQQRVALARSLAPAPSLLMLDEPLGSLDRELRERLAVELRDLFTRLGLTAVFVTHDHDEAFAIGDRVAVLRGGRIEQIDPPVDLWRRPRTEFVARFLGWDVTDVFGERVAVRPDGLRIAGSGSSDGATVEATVTSRVFRRDHYVIAVRVGDRSVLHVAVPPGDAPELDEVVRVEPTAGALVPIR